MPDPRARSPHTPVFDQHEILWFTTESSNFVGRLDPSTVDIKLQQVPTPDAVPYDIVVSTEGVPYFCEFGTNRLASIDPKTLAHYRIPLAQSRFASAPAGSGS